MPTVTHHHVVIHWSKVCEWGIHRILVKSASCKSTSSGEGYSTRNRRTLTNAKQIQPSHGEQWKSAVFEKKRVEEEAVRETEQKIDVVRRSIGYDLSVRGTDSNWRQWDLDALSRRCSDVRRPGRCPWRALRGRGRALLVVLTPSFHQFRWRPLCIDSRIQEENPSKNL